MPDQPVIYRLATDTADGKTWLLKRNCSLTPRQAVWAYGLLAGVSLVVALSFWWLGAVMVLPFAALELTALALAFLVYSRHAADRETIQLSPSRLVVEWENGGRIARHEFPREWVRVVPGAGRGDLVSLSASGEVVQVGRYVRPDLRAQLATEIRHALCPL